MPSSTQMKLDGGFDLMNILDFWDLSFFNKTLQIGKTQSQSMNREPDELNDSCRFVSIRLKCALHNCGYGA
jgi:hypothetical protein